MLYIMPPPLYELLLLLLIYVCSFLETVQASDSYNPPYTIQTPGKGAVMLEDNVHVKSLDYQGIYTDPIDMLEISWLNSTTHSISIGWILSKSYNVTGFVTTSVVEYYPKGGRFRSHPLQRDVSEYTFVQLEVGTLYTICVYLTELYGEQNLSSIVHSKCVKINTIQYLRRDSIVIVLITLGYYAFMGLLGYTQWKRRLWRIRKLKKNKNRCNQEVASDNEKANICVMRWRDLAERERLVSKPGCSIECNDT